MRGGDERLGAILDPLDRHAQPLGDDGGHVLLAVDVDLGAEAAADLGGDGPHLVLAQAGHGRDHRPQDVRILGRRPDRHRPLAGFEVRDDAARLHRIRHQALVHHALRDHDLGRSKGLVDRGVVHRAAIGADAGAARHQRHREVVGEVGVDHDRLAGHRLLEIDDRGERIDIDDDGIGGVTRGVAVAGDHDRHRFPGVADHVGGHGPMRRRGEWRADRHWPEHLGDLGAGEHRLDAVHRQGGGDVDRADAAVRDVAALERQVLHADDLDVVDVGAAPLDEARIFAALDALADELRQDGSRGHGYLLPAACWMALTMC